jgi:hypothetical protein
MADAIEPPDRGEWPKVASTGSPPPATSVAVEDGTVLVEPPRVIAYGRVSTSKSRKHTRSPRAGTSSVERPS